MSEETLMDLFSRSFVTQRGLGGKEASGIL
jgi:hypothetical protein